MRRADLPFLLLATLVAFASTIIHALDFFSFIPKWLFYSDLFVFFDPHPSLAKPFTYPPLQELFIYFTNLVGGGHLGYYLVASFLLTLAFLFSTFLLLRLTEEPKRLGKYWLASLTILYFLIFNWDILTIFSVLAAFWFFKQNRYSLTSVFLAVGFATKIYPVLYFLALLLLEMPTRAKVKLAVIFVLVAGGLNLPFFIFDRAAWSHFWLWQGSRAANPDSLLGIFNHYLALGNSLTNLLAWLSLLIGLLLVLFKQRQQNYFLLCFSLTLVFILTNKIFSPQYLLWLLPFFVLLKDFIPNTRFYLLEVSNLLIIFILYFAFLYQLEPIFALLASLVLLRQFLLLRFLTQTFSPRNARTTF